MFIDLGVTKLLDIREVRELHKKILFGRLGYMKTKSSQDSMLNTLEDIFRAFNPNAPRYLCSFTKEQNGHLSLVVALDANVSINGTWREKFISHNQLHISKELVCLSISYTAPKNTVGLLVASNQVKNPEYYSPTAILSELLRKNRKNPNIVKVHDLLPKIVGILEQNTLVQSEARVLVEFIKEVCPFLTKPETPITTKTRFKKIVNLKPTTDELNQWHTQVLKAYLMLAKHYGNYAILANRVWS